MNSSRALGTLTILPGSDGYKNGGKFEVITYKIEQTLAKLAINSTFGSDIYFPVNWSRLPVEMNT